MSEWKVGDEAVHDGDLCRVRILNVEGREALMEFEGRSRNAWVYTEDLKRPEPPKDFGTWQDGAAGIIADAAVIRAGTSIATATGEQLDKLAALVGIDRRAGETIVDLRKRRQHIAAGLGPFPSPSVIVKRVVGLGEELPKPGTIIGVSVEVRSARSGEPWVDIFPAPVKPRGIDTTPPTRAEAREVVADLLGISGRYVSDELADTEIERRVAELEDWATSEQRAKANKLARDGAANADDEGYLFSRYGGRYPEGSRGGTIHFPTPGPGGGRRYTMSVPPGVNASFLCWNDAWEWFIGYASGMHGDAPSLSLACDAVDEAIRKEMAEKPEREPWPTQYIGTCSMGERGRR